MEQQSEIRISDRQREILRIIIEEYTSTARPVASEQLVARYGLSVSSATVRNDMVDLERAGLITHPHTSAGRIPTDRGYRYFVENLMHPANLSADEQRMIRHQFHQVEMNAEEWVRLAAAVLARTVRSAAMATAPRSNEVHLKHFELIGISDSRIMLVLVSRDGTVSQQMITIDEEWDQARLGLLAARLNAALGGKTGSEIKAWARDEENVRALPSVAQQVVATLGGLLSKLEKPESSPVYHEGLVNILDQPEFRQPEKMQQVLELFESGIIWSGIIPSVMGQEGVQVIIGEEGTGMAQCSVVLARYGLTDRLSGVVGVVGPTRMPYSRSVSSVSYMSRLLSDMLNRIYNRDREGDFEQ